MFRTIDNREISCMTYKHHRIDMRNKLVAVNIQYIAGYVNSWVIFQVTALDNIKLDDKAT